MRRPGLGIAPPAALAVLLACSYPATAQDCNEFTGAEATIREKCKTDWPEDYNMQLFCFKEQKRAVSRLKRGGPRNVPEDVFGRIRIKCCQDWPEDYNMRLYCEKEQIRGYRAVRRQGAQDVPTKIVKRVKRKCARDWPDDHSMQRYCIEEQLEAWRELNPTPPPPPKPAAQSPSEGGSDPIERPERRRGFGPDGPANEE